MSEILDRAAILTGARLATERLRVPEWAGDVYVRELTGAERDAWEGSIIDAEGKPRGELMRNARARLAVMSLVDEHGIRLFADSDAEALGRTSARALARVFDVAARLSGLTAGDLEELEKNSGGARRADSGTDSP